MHYIQEVNLVMKNELYIIHQYGHVEIHLKEHMDKQQITRGRYYSLCHRKRACHIITTLHALFTSFH